MTKQPTKTVERVALDSLTPDPDNARIHGRDNLRSIAASLERFGQVRPLLVTADDVVIAGNGSMAAMHTLGWSECLVVRLPWTDREQCRAYAIVDNRTAELASWDSSVLGEQVQEMNAAGIPMTALGFDFPGDDDAAPGAADRAAAAEAGIAYRCPACGFRWRSAGDGEVVPL